MRLAKMYRDGEMLNDVNEKPTSPGKIIHNHWMNLHG
jgi:hypothetical protein